MESLKDKLLAMAAQLTECAHNLDQYSEVAGVDAGTPDEGAAEKPMDMAEAMPMKSMKQLKAKSSKYNA